MAKVYGEIGSLEQLLSLLKGKGVNFLSSLDEISTFNENYNTKMAEIEEEIRNEMNLEVKEIKETILTMQDDYKRKLADREQTLINEKDNIRQFNIEVQHVGQRGKVCYSTWLWENVTGIWAARKESLSLECDMRGRG